MKGAFRLKIIKPNERKHLQWEKKGKYREVPTETQINK